MLLLFDHLLRPPSPPFFDQVLNDRWFADPVLSPWLEELVPQPIPTDDANPRESTRGRATTNKGMFGLPFGRRATNADRSSTAAALPAPKPQQPSGPTADDVNKEVGDWLDSRMASQGSTDGGVRGSRDRLNSVSNPWESGSGGGPPPPSPQSSLKDKSMPSPVQPMQMTSQPMQPTPAAGLPSIGEANPFGGLGGGAPPGAPMADPSNPFGSAPPPPPGAANAPIDLSALSGAMPSPAAAMSAPLDLSELSLSPAVTVQPGGIAGIAAAAGASMNMPLQPSPAAPMQPTPPPPMQPTPTAMLQPTPAALLQPTPPPPPLQPTPPPPPLQPTPAAPMQPGQIGQVFSAQLGGGGLMPPAPLQPTPAPVMPPATMAPPSSGGGALSADLFAAPTFAPAAAPGAIDRKAALAAAAASGSPAPSAAGGMPPMQPSAVMPPPIPPSAPAPAPAPVAAAVMPPPIPSMLTPTPSPQPSPQPSPMDVAWRKLCIPMEGMLTGGPTIQIGFKGDFRAHAARVGIYLGNVSSTPLTGLSVELQVPPATQPALSATAASVQDTLAPRAQAMMMISCELSAPFTQPPVLAIRWQSGGGGGAAVYLPVLPMRFLTPWPLGKDDFFRLWRTEGLSESQSKFTFASTFEPAQIKQLLSTSLKLAVLEGVDPSPNNLTAAAALACKGGVAPPSPGGHYCLLRLEIVPGHATAPDGTKRSASRLTVRSSSAPIGDGLMQALTAHIGGVLPASNRL